MKSLSWMALLLVSTQLQALAQRDYSQVEIKTTPVAQNVHMLEGAGGNIGVSVGADGILIVDDQFAPLADKIEAAVGKLNPGKLRFVLNTHHHGDHVGGNGVFGGKGATIIAQSNVRDRLLKDSNLPKEAYPVITFDRSASVHFNGEEIKLIHHGPGHTDGDSVIHFTGANVVHMGDQFVNSFPYIDFNSGGDVDGYVKTVEVVLQKIPEDAKIIRGHGSLATVGDLREYHSMLIQTIALVRRQIAEGKSLDDIKAAGLPEPYQKFSSGFISANRWIESIHRSTPKP